VPSSSLLPDDPSVLLTTAGMQQFKKYYTGDLDPFTTVHPNLGKPLGSRNAVSVQKSFRTSDIDEVGDESHLTFFEMLGNFSFGYKPGESGSPEGGYFKEEAIRYAFEFITKECGLTISKVTVFEGKDTIGVPEDVESAEIWKSMDKDIHIEKQGMEDVFWGPTGTSGPCGPTTEIYCKNKGQEIEIWNIVFNEFFFAGSREELLSGSSSKKLEKLATPGVDTGMGLERLAMISQNTGTIFETDLFMPFMDMPDFVANSTKRIIADHGRAIVFLIADGVLPSNKDAGYILRRLMRRFIVKFREFEPGGHYTVLGKIIEQYQQLDAYTYLDKEKIFAVFHDELAKFEKTLHVGTRELAKMEHINAASAFNLYQSYGLPYEVIKDLSGTKAEDLKRDDFDQEFEKHQELSRAGREAKFGGHGLLLDTGELKARDEEELKKVTRLHTATHLLQAALRVVLGEGVHQDGSDITAERLRFDFTLDRRLTPDEVQHIEDWVNDVVEKDVPMECKEMPFEEAIQTGALYFTKEKYPAVVKVYSAHEANNDTVYSRELCGGPHVTHTGDVGTFKILKQEAVGAGVRRIRADVL
jgi:alanyl-tRNA synthetase